MICSNTISIENHQFKSKLVNQMQPKRQIKTSYRYNDVNLQYI